MADDDFKFGDPLNFYEVPPPEHGGGTYFYICTKCGHTSSICQLCYENGLAKCYCAEGPEIYLLGFSA